MPKKHYPYKEGHLSTYGATRIKHFNMTRPYLNQRKAKIGDKVIIESNKVNRSTWVNNHWQHNGIINGVKNMAPKGGLSIKCHYLLECVDCDPLEEKWVVASQFIKGNKS
tara:strand:+ start:5070 stop:5399 length:330 start_codon:yes stop_codon:yes gene_type:complete